MRERARAGACVCMRVRVCACVCAHDTCVSDPPLKVFRSFYRGVGLLFWIGWGKKIEARFGLQQAGVENQKMPQVNILESWLNASKLHSTEIRGNAIGIRFGQWIVLSRQLGSVSQSLAVALFLHP